LPNCSCVEAYAGGWAMVRDLRAAGHDVSTVDDAVGLIRAGDLAAVRLARRAARILGGALADVVNLFNPSVIAVAGQFAHIDEQLFGSGWSSRPPADVVIRPWRALPTAADAKPARQGGRRRAHRTAGPRRHQLVKLTAGPPTVRSIRALTLRMVKENVRRLGRLAGAATIEPACCGGWTPS
jgi:predicted NBD/HSP70 family sugar kinase